MRIILTEDYRHNPSFGSIILEDLYTSSGRIIILPIGGYLHILTFLSEIHDLVSVAIMGRLFSHCSADHHTTWNFCWGHAKMSLVTLFSSQLSRRRHGGTFTSTSGCTMQQIGRAHV